MISSPTGFPGVGPRTTSNMLAAEFESLLVESDHFIVAQVLSNDSVFGWQRTAV
jgi:hypothetical protein